MRPYALALAALLAAPVPSAALPACRATAEVPDTTSSHYGATAAGSFGCDTARPWLAVEVCLEVLDPAGWVAAGCDTFTATGASYVSGSTWTCRYGLTLVRSAAYGAASTGETATAVSPPVPYYCTPI